MLLPPLAVPPSSTISKSNPCKAVPDKFDVGVKLSSPNAMLVNGIVSPTLTIDPLSKRLPLTGVELIFIAEKLSPS